VVVHNRIYYKIHSRYDGPFPILA